MEEKVKNNFELMKRCPLFANMNNEEFDSIIKSPYSQIKIFLKNQEIIAEGEAADFIGIILYGTVHIIRNDYYGNRSIIALIDAPQIFAEVFALSEIKSMPISVISAIESNIMLINLKKFMTENSIISSKLSNNLLRLISAKNLKLNEKIEAISQRTIRDKIMTFLMQQAKCHGSDTFTIPYDRQALADFLEVDRSAMSAEISKLRNDGIIESKKAKFKLLKKIHDYSEH